MKKTGKRMGLAAAMLGGLVLSTMSITAHAQQDGPPPPPPPQGAEQGPPQGGPGGPGGPGGRGGMMNPERRIKMMTRALNLSTDQQATIRQIFADQEAKMQAQRDSGQSMAPEDRRAAMMAMRQDEKAKIEAVLTPDQKVKFEQMEAQMREREQGRREQGPPPPPPSQQSKAAS